MSLLGLSTKVAPVSKIAFGSPVYGATLTRSDQTSHCKRNTSSGSMPIELSSYVYETLRADEEFGLYRARREGDPSTFLVVTPVSEYPSLGSLARLEHTYSLRDELDSEWAVRPYSP